MQVSKCLVGLALVASAAASITQVHVTLSSEAVGCKDGVALTFASDVSTSLRVDYGVGATDKTATTIVDSYKIEADDYEYQSPNLHTALLCNLRPSTEYSYTMDGFEGSFKSIPAPAKKTVLSVVGDVGVASVEGIIANMGSPLNGSTPDAVIVAGDWSYANGDHETWDEWLDATQPLFSKVPVAGINGNHEIIQGQVKENYSGYLHRIVTPITAEASKDRRTWYSKNIGNIHAIFLDDYTGVTSTKSNTGSSYWLVHRNQQLEWFKKDLASIDRAATPYVIVFKHNPYYNSWGNHQCQCSPVKFEIPEDMVEACWAGDYYRESTPGGGYLGSTHSEPHCGLQAKFENLYFKHGVDAVIAGHVHSYERTAPIYKNKINKDGPTYFTVGTGRDGLKEDAIEPLPQWSKKLIKNAYGAMRIIADQNKLTIHFRANGETTKVLDTVQVPRRTNLKV